MTQATVVPNLAPNQNLGRFLKKMSVLPGQREKSPAAADGIPLVMQSASGQGRACHRGEKRSGRRRSSSPGRDGRKRSS